MRCRRNRGGSHHLVGLGQLAHIKLRRRKSAFIPSVGRRYYCEQLVGTTTASTVWLAGMWTLFPFVMLSCVKDEGRLLSCGISEQGARLEWADVSRLGFSGSESLDEVGRMTQMRSALNDFDSPLVVSLSESGRVREVEFSSLRDARGAPLCWHGEGLRLVGDVDAEISDLDGNVLAVGDLEYLAAGPSPGEAFLSGALEPTDELLQAFAGVGQFWVYVDRRLESDLQVVAESVDGTVLGAWEVVDSR